MKNYIYLFIFFFTSCSHSSNLLIHIPEASGICYMKQSDSLFIASDEGSVYEINTEGKILRQQELGKFDLEGVACDEKNNRLLFAVEKSDNVLVVDAKTFTIQKEVNIKRSFDGVKVIKKDEENGLEGITIVDDTLYLSNQSTRKWPESDASVLIQIDSLEKEKASITQIVDHGYIDIAGLCYHNGYMYMVSDTDDLLIIYDLKTAKTIKEVKLESYDQEGIAFDNKGFVYITDDKGSIRRYKAAQLIGD